MTFTIYEVEELSGATERKLQIWDEYGLIVPSSKQGHRRCYSAEDALLACVMMDLRAKTISLQKVRRIWKKVRKAVPGQSWFATDGVTIREPRAETLLDYTSSFQKPIVVIDVGAHWNRVQQYVRRKATAA